MQLSSTPMLMVGSGGLVVLVVVGAVVDVDAGG